MTCEPMGETACLLKLDSRIDPIVNGRVHALAKALRDAAIVGTTDIVPGYASLLLRHNLVRRAAVARWYRQVRAVARGTPASAPDHSATMHHIAVHYDGADLAYVAQYTGMPVEEVIHRHVSVEYRVAMVGFSPGFPYLMGMDPRLATPRRATPRIMIPAGAVAIGGTQTGIYPRPSPGGWQLIAHTSTRLFDPGNPLRPCLLEPGDCVRFVRVDGVAEPVVVAH